MKIALALSGGGIRAVAHLGVIKVLIDNGFEISAISGSSAGALIGALLASKKSPDEILNIIKSIKMFDLIKYPKLSRGVFSLKGLYNILDKNISVKKIEDSSIELIIVCTDLVSGEIVYFNKGPIVDLSIASSSLVPIFTPVKYNGMLLADGGFIDNMPVVPLIKLNLPIIAVNVNPIVKKEAGNLFKTSIRTLFLMMNANVEFSKKYCDFYLEPLECEKFNIFDLRRANEAYEAGVAEAKRLLPQILNKISNS